MKTLFKSVWMVLFAFTAGAGLNYPRSGDTFKSNIKLYSRPKFELADSLVLELKIEKTPEDKKKFNDLIENSNEIIENENMIKIGSTASRYDSELMLQPELITNNEIHRKVEDNKLEDHKRLQRHVNIIEEENFATTVSGLKFTERETRLYNHLLFKNINS